MVIGSRFFNRPVLKVARELIGKFLVRRRNSGTTSEDRAGMIIEAEAYDGFRDKASHASRGLTSRNAVMFGSAGRWYVYLIYGNHWMLNIVTGPKNYPAAVLIRGIRATFDIGGPGRLTKYFDIDKGFNNKKANCLSGLWIEDRGVIIKEDQIKRGPRIGVDYAGPVWARKFYRFYYEQ